MSLDGGSYAAAVSPYAIANVAEGSHTLRVRAIDAAGNIDPSPAAFTWSVDATPPTVDIVFPGAVAYTDATTIQVRGTAADANIITALTVNGATATTSDNFRHWVATVGVNSGSNSYAIAATDSAGNTAPGAATLGITNRGPVLARPYGLAVDAAKGHVLFSERDRGEIFALRLSDGIVSVFSDATRGTGPVPSAFRSIIVDDAHDRLLTYGGGRVMAIDRTTGDRTYVSSSASAGYEIYGSVAYEPSNNTLYGCGSPSNVVAINLDTDTRQILAANTFGSGISMVQLSGALLDVSAAGGGHRLLVSDVGSFPGDSQSRLIGVDLTTGVRTILSSSGSPAVGSGPAIYGIGSMTLDAANNRVIVATYARSAPSQLVAIDLATGNRTTLGTSDSTTSTAIAAVDPSDHFIYMALYDRARVLRFDTNTQDFSRFADSNVGDGLRSMSINSMKLDTSGGRRSLLQSVQLSEFGGIAGALRLDLGTSSRTLLTGPGVGTGPDIIISQSAQPDIRPGALPDQLIIHDEASPSRFIGVDLATGNRTVLSTPNLSYDSSPHVVLDPATGQMMAAERPSLSDPFTLSGIDVTMGTRSEISGPTRGTGPDVSANSGEMVDIAIDAVSGRPKTYLLAAPDSTLTVVNAASGDRTRIVPTGIAPRISGMDLDATSRRAYVVGNGSLSVIDLQTGAGQEISGPNTGSGPSLIGDQNGVQVDIARGVAYVSSQQDTVTVVDLTSGQRAIVSR